MKKIKKMKKNIKKIKKIHRGRSLDLGPGWSTELRNDVPSLMEKHKGKEVILFRKARKARRGELRVVACSIITV